MNLEIKNKMINNKLNILFSTLLFMGTTHAVEFGSCTFPNAGKNHTIAWALLDDNNIKTNWGNHIPNTAQIFTGAQGLNMLAKLELSDQSNTLTISTNKKAPIGSSLHPIPTTPPFERLGIIKWNGLIKNNLVMQQDPQSNDKLVHMVGTDISGAHMCTTVTIQNYCTLTQINAMSDVITSLPFDGRRIIQFSDCTLITVDTPNI
jgi:hypothetical protein